MTKTTALLVSAVLIASASLSAHAGVNQFTNISPEGAYITALLVHPSNPSILYAGSSAGVQKSVDGGETWTLSVDWADLDKSLTSRSIRSLAIDPVHRDTVYAALDTGELLRTADGGTVWSLLPGPPFVSQPNQSRYFNLLVDSTQAGTLYAWNWNSVWQSTDGGTSWTAWLSGLPQSLADVYLVAVDPLLPSRIFARSRFQAHMTVDRGQNWTILGSGLPLDILVTDPGDPNTLYGASSNALVTSTDLGKTWTTSRIAGPVYSIVINPDSSAAYALTRSYVDGMEVRRALVTVDKGHTWTPLPNSLEHISMLVIDPSDGKKFYAVTSDRLFKSANSGGDWKAINTGLSSPGIWDLASDPSSPSTLFAATAGGIMKSMDGGQHWSEEKIYFPFGKLALDPSAPSTVFAFGSGPTAVRSQDGGESWSGINLRAYTGGITVDPSNSAVVYAALSDGLAKSTNGGADWGSIGVGRLPLGYYGFGGTAVVVDPEVPSTVYAAGDGGIVKSGDSGVTWKTTYQDSNWYGSQILDLLIDPRRTSTLYALSPFKVLRSDNSGLDWRVVDRKPEYYGGDAIYNRDLAIDPTEPSRLYMATNRGLFRSAGRGEHWSEFNTGLPARMVNRVTVDSLGNVFASTNRGLFVNSPNGARPDASSYSVSLRTWYGNFVSSADCGGSSLNANATAAGRCESFVLFDLDRGSLNDGDRIQLRAQSGAYVVAEDGDAGDGILPLKANRAIAGIWETFIIRRTAGAGVIRSGDSISLQSSDGNYVTAENGGANGCSCDAALTANRTVARAWESFTITIH